MRPAALLLGLALPQAAAEGAYRYFRLNVTQSLRHTAGGQAVLAEVKWWAGSSLSWFEPSMGMTEWDLPEPYVASCSGSAHVLEPCWRAFDHLATTAWRSAGTFTATTGAETTMDGLEWLTLDVGPDRMLDPTAVSLLCDPWAEDRDARDCPRSFAALGSADGASWDLLGSWEDLSLDDHPDEGDGGVFYLSSSVEVAADDECALGSFLAAPGLCQPCPAGTFGNETGLASAACSGACAAGYYCTEGASDPQEHPCGGADVFCPAGSARPAPVRLGHYSLPEDEDALKVAEEPCPAGHTCSGGLRAECPAGTYGNLTHETRARCEGRCPFGTTCAPASTAPTTCPAGHFCPSGWQSWPCPAGRYGEADGESSSLCSAACPAGHYCPAASTAPTACPAGRWGAAEGLATEDCDGECWAGFYCPEGSTAPDAEACPELHHCAAGAAEPAALSLGFYLPTPVRERQAVCPLGSYCPGDGERHACPAGRYGGSLGLADDACSGACAAGFYCPANSTSAEEEACPAGRYGLAEGLPDATCDGECPPGSFCAGDAAAMEECPAGRYGAAYGLADEACDGECAAGYYCEAGATVATQHHCGDADAYCPRGSAAPSAVDEGYYSIEAQAAQAQCAPGSYCAAGVAHACPAGRYGASWGLADADCDGACAAGHYCPAGSVSATELRCPAGRYGATEGLSSPYCTGPCAAGAFCEAGSVNASQAACGGNAWFCPEGSRAPKPVAPGFYSFSGVGPEWRVEQLRCPAGSYCVDGVAEECPAGRYGDVAGLALAECSGPCARGHYCPRGSVEAHAVPCPAGRYGDVVGLATAECSGACVSGYECPEGTIEGLSGGLSP